MIDAINAAGLGITAGVNQAGNGIELVDTTRPRTGHSRVANADSTTPPTSCTSPSIRPTATSVNSGDLHLQVVAENTRLADLNGGAGVASGTFTIHDTNGQRPVLDLRRAASRPSAT